MYERVTPEFVVAAERAQDERLCEDAVRPVVERFGVVPTLRAMGRHCERIALASTEAVERWIEGFASREIAACSSRVAAFVRRENERMAARETTRRGRTRVHDKGGR